MTIPVDVLAAWRTGEEKLYPVVMTRPDLYERAVRIVRAMADELRSCGTLDELVAAWPEAAGILSRAAAQALLPLAELDRGLLAGAAFSMRYRELAADAAFTERGARVRAAEEAGQAWVTVEQIGSPETAGLSPYTWVEMHTGGPGRGTAGVALRLSIGMDLDTGGPAFSVEVIMCDPVTGAVLADTDGLSLSDTYSTRAEWETAVAELRAELETGRPGGPDS